MGKSLGHHQAGFPGKGNGGVAPGRIEPFPRRLPTAGKGDVAVELLAPYVSL